MGQKVKLQGERDLVCASVSFKAQWKAMEMQEQRVLVEFGGLQTSPPPEGSLPQVPKELQEIVQAYPQVFEEPQRLPPSRGKEHRITLEPGSRPVSVRSFCYPQAQKEEIEKQVRAMLAAGIILSSNSPFYSLVLMI